MNLVWKIVIICYSFISSTKSSGWSEFIQSHIMKNCANFQFHSWSSSSDLWRIFIWRCLISVFKFLLTPLSTLALLSYKIVVWKLLKFLTRRRLKINGHEIIPKWKRGKIWKRENTKLHQICCLFCAFPFFSQ